MKYDGRGPAFPVMVENKSGEAQCLPFGAGDVPPGATAIYWGMSERDLIACHAMAAIISKLPFAAPTPDDAVPVAERVATGAYIYADAMMAARGTGG